MQIITFNNVELHLQEHPQHEFLLTNKEVALGYGASLDAMNMARNRHADELIEGKHWIRETASTKGGKQKVIKWTKKGIVRLGFFIKSEDAKKFRDWAEDYIVNKRATPTPDPPQTPAQTIRYNVGPLPADIATIVDILKSLNPKEKKDVMRYALTINLKTMPNLLREMADNYDKIN